MTTAPTSLEVASLKKLLRIEETNPALLVIPYEENITPLI